MPEEVSVVGTNGAIVDDFMEVREGSSGASSQRIVDEVRGSRSHPNSKPRQPSAKALRSSRSSEKSPGYQVAPASSGRSSITRPLPAVNSTNANSFSVVTDTMRAAASPSRQRPGQVTRTSSKKMIANETQPVIPDNINASLDILAAGLYRLMQAQRRFGDEFGLSAERVFSADISFLHGKGIEEMKRWLLASDELSRKSLQDLLEDFFQHQAALISTLDIVARRSIRYLAPDITHRLAKQRKGVTRFAPIWSQYRERHHKIETNPQTRYKIIIAPGVQAGYANSRQAQRQRASGRNKEKDQG